MRKIYYGWTIVAVSFVCFALAIGARFTFSIFYVAMLKDFGWSRGETAGAFSLGMIIYALSAPLLGGVIDRLGPRAVFPPGALLLGLGLVLSSRINAIWHLYLLQGFVVSFGISGMGFTSNTTYISRWFRRYRGTANGIAGAGMGFGLLVLAPTIQYVIETRGWRSAYMIFGMAIPAIMVPLSLIFQKRDPQSMGLNIDGAPEPPRISREAELPSEPSGSHAASRAEIIRLMLRTPAFLLILPLSMALGFNNNIMLIHSVAHMVDHGYSAMLAATVLGLVNVLRIAGSLLGGWSSDKIGRRNAYLLGVVSNIVGIVFFMQVAPGSAYLYGFLLFYGFGLGSLSPIYGALIADVAPARNLGLLIGITEIAYGVGGGLGPWFAGAMFDRLQSYSLPFTVVLIVTAVGGLCVVAITRLRQGMNERPGDASPDATVSG